MSQDETNQRSSEQTVGVIGAGLMGSGIAQVAAQAGWQVVLRDVRDEALARGISGIETSIGRFVDKGRVTQDDADAAVARITTTTQLDAVADANIVVEAAFEDIAVKHEVSGPSMRSVVAMPCLQRTPAPSPSHRSLQ